MKFLSDLISIATTFFLVANPIGNSPTILAVVRDYSIAEQRRLLLRESCFALLLALFFAYGGKAFLGAIFVENYTLAIAGGVLLLLISLGMIFPNHPPMAAEKKSAPLFVPIATPLICGPGLLTTIMLDSQRYPEFGLITMALLTAWIAITTCLVLSPYLNILLKERGMLALEQLMGMLLLLIGVEMLTGGLLLMMTAHR